MYPLLVLRWPSLQKYGKITHSSPAYPQPNGLAERTIQSVKNMLKATNRTGIDPHLALLHLRNTPITGLKYSPAQLLMVRVLRSDLKIKRSYDIITPLGAQYRRYRRHLRPDRVPGHRDNDGMTGPDSDSDQEIEPGQTETYDMSEPEPQTETDIGQRSRVGRSIKLPARLQNYVLKKSTVNSGYFFSEMFHVIIVLNVVFNVYSCFKVLKLFVYQYDLAKKRDVV